MAGYEDCNDADTLRSDPMLKTVCDQLPESDPDLATQPTFSRLENSVTKKDPEPVAANVRSLVPASHPGSGQ